MQVTEKIESADFRRSRHFFNDLAMILTLKAGLVAGRKMSPWRRS